MDKIERQYLSNDSELEISSRMLDDFRLFLAECQKNQNPYYAKITHRKLTSRLKEAAKNCMKNKDVKNIRLIAQIGKDLDKEFNISFGNFFQKSEPDDAVFEGEILENRDSIVSNPLALLNQEIEKSGLNLSLTKKQKKEFVQRLRTFFIDYRVKYDKLHFLSTDKETLNEGFAIILDAIKRGLKYEKILDETELQIDNLGDVVNKGLLRRSMIVNTLSSYFKEYNVMQEYYFDSSKWEKYALNDEVSRSYQYKPTLLTLDKHLPLNRKLYLKPNLDQEEKLLSRIEMRIKILDEIFDDLKINYKNNGIYLPDDIQNHKDKIKVIRTALYGYTKTNNLNYVLPVEKLLLTAEKQNIEIFLMQVWKNKYYQKPYEYCEEAQQYLTDLYNQASWIVDKNSEKIENFIKHPENMSVDDIIITFRTNLGDYLVTYVPNIFEKPQTIDSWLIKKKLIEFNGKIYPNYKYLKKVWSLKVLNIKNQIKMYFDPKNEKLRVEPAPQAKEDMSPISYKREKLDDYIMDRLDKRENVLFLARESFRDFHIKMIKKYDLQNIKKTEILSYDQYPYDEILSNQLFQRLDNLGFRINL